MNVVALSMLGLGAWALLRPKAPSAPLVPFMGSVTKKPWLTRVVGESGSGPQKTVVVEVWAPRGRYGPHDEVLVTTYRQAGEAGKRTVVSVGPQALPQMVTDAGKDFEIYKAP